VASRGPSRAGAGPGSSALTRAGVPDYVAPAVGWRGWLVVELEGALRLCSPRFWTVWLPRTELVALCRLGECPYWPLRQLLPGHAAPDEGCRCGIYAAATATQAAASVTAPARPRGEIVHLRHRPRLSLGNGGRVRPRLACRVRLPRFACCSPPPAANAEAALPPPAPAVASLPPGRGDRTGAPRVRRPGRAHRLRDARRARRDARGAHRLRAAISRGVAKFPTRLPSKEVRGHLARANTKPGKGSYVCSKCEASQELRTAASTLKACPNCGSMLFRKASSRSSAA
jgi:DNA-directed RNA polymerase subunit RPC12/RpoP